MSEEQNESGQTEWPDKKKESGAARSIVLYGVLALMLIALGYDYMVARPSVSQAYDKISKASVEANKAGNDFLSNLEVRELLGKEPAETFDDGNQKVEVFHYMGGLVVKPHKLFTVYRKSGDELMFSRHAKFAYDPSNSVGPTESKIVQKDVTATEAPGYGEDDDGGGAPGGGGPGGGGPAAGGGAPGGSSAPPSGGGGMPAGSSAPPPDAVPIPLGTNPYQDSADAEAEEGDTEDPDADSSDESAE